MRSWYMSVLLPGALTICRLFALQRGVQVGFYPVFCDTTLLRSIVLVAIIHVSRVPRFLLFLLLSGEPDVGIALDVEGEGDENVSNDGGDNADEGRPFS